MKMLDFSKTIWYNVLRKRYRTKGDYEMDVISLSNYMITLFEKQSTPVTNLKLQKTLYYVQGYFYKHLGRAAFSDEIYNWQYGPVVPTVYYEYNNNGSAPLATESYFDDCTIDDCKKNLIESIVKKCSSISTSRLVAMTHSETPWKNSCSGNVIEKKSIEMFFKHNNPLGIKYDRINHSFE